MLQENQQVRTLAIVVVGNFNPAIIQPYWLAKKNLIKEPEAENAKIEFVHPQLTKFDITWASFEVSSDRFVIRSSNETMFQTVFDLFDGIFTCLSETPIKAIGLNHIIHYIIPNDDKYIEFGNRLAPFNNWDKVMDSPRLLHLEMIEQKRRDKYKGHYIVKIQPSDLIKGKNSIMISFNDHLALEENNEGSYNTLLKNVKEVWPASFKRVDEVIDNLSKTTAV